MRKGSFVRIIRSPVMFFDTADIPIVGYTMLNSRPINKKKPWASDTQNHLKMEVPNAIPRCHDWAKIFRDPSFYGRTAANSTLAALHFTEEGYSLRYSAGLFSVALALGKLLPNIWAKFNVQQIVTWNCPFCTKTWNYWVNFLNCSLKFIKRRLRVHSFK